MAEYHVGCGAFNIYAGRLNKAKNEWVSKTECTMEAMSSVAQYIKRHKRIRKNLGINNDGVNEFWMFMV